MVCFFLLLPVNILQFLPNRIPQFFNSTLNWPSSIAVKKIASSFVGRKLKYERAKK